MPFPPQDVRTFSVSDVEKLLLVKSVYMASSRKMYGFTLEGGTSDNACWITSMATIHVS